MRLWLLSQTENSGYDTYDSVVVAADTEEDARRIHPEGAEVYGRSPWDRTRFPAWASSPALVSVRLIGEADASITEPGIILASFNAG